MVVVVVVVGVVVGVGVGVRVRVRVRVRVGVVASEAWYQRARFERRKSAAVGGATRSSI